jgi:hypothetical protein
MAVRRTRSHRVQPSDAPGGDPRAVARDGRLSDVAQNRWLDMRLCARERGGSPCPRWAAAPPDDCGPRSASAGNCVSDAGLAHSRMALCILGVPAPGPAWDPQAFRPTPWLGPGVAIRLSAAPGMRPQPAGPTEPPVSRETEKSTNHLVGRAPMFHVKQTTRGLPRSRADDGRAACAAVRRLESAAPTEGASPKSDPRLVEAYRSRRRRLG